MSYKTSLYNGVKSFLYDSTKDVQWATGIMYGAGAGAAYGLGSGILSDNTSVFGGTVGGATFGAAAGAGLAYSTNKSAAIRGALRDITNSAFGVNKAIRNMVDEDISALEAAKGKAATTSGFDSMSAGDKQKIIDGMLDRSTLNVSKAENLGAGQSITLSNGLRVNRDDFMHAYSNQSASILRKNNAEDADILSSLSSLRGKSDSSTNMDDFLKQFDRYK